MRRTISGYEIVGDNYREVEVDIQVLSSYKFVTWKPIKDCTHWQAIFTDANTIEDSDYAQLYPSLGENTKRILRDKKPGIERVRVLYADIGSISREEMIDLSKKFRLCII